MKRWKVFISVICFLFLSTSCSSRYSKKTEVQSTKVKEYRTKKNKRSPLVVVIDPGHGGKDSGSVSRGKKKSYEKTLALKTSKLVQTYLQQMGYRVIMTRQTDVFIPLIKRSEIANKNQADLFVSIHYNASSSRNAIGMEVFYYPDTKNKKRKQDSGRLAQSILHHAAYTTRTKNRGVKQGNFSVIRNTKMPAILFEGGFMTHAWEVKRLNKESYQNKIAKGIAKGIDDYSKKR